MCAVNLAYFTWFFFGFSGRVSRDSFALAGLLLYVFRFYPIYRIMAAAGDEAEQTFWGGVFLVLLVVLLISHMALAAKRLHDFGRSGWWSLLFPIGDIFAYIFLCIVAGNPGPNRYGRFINAPA